MYKQILRTMQDAEVFPMLSLIIFTIIFVSVLVWVVTLDRKTVQHVERLPLESDLSNDLPSGGRN